MSDPGDGPAHADRARASDELLGRSLALVRFLRDGCPWDARQTPESLRPYLLEEAHETADAVLRGDDRELAGELGDLLLNLAFQIVLAEERGAFDAEEVVRGLEAKMEARHPHVYGDAEEPPDWEETKARESGRGGGGSGADGGDAEGDAAEAGAAGGPSRGRDRLSRAFRTQQRAAGLGFDWPSADGPLSKLREEIEELEDLLARPRRPRGDEETGGDGGRDDRPARAGGTVPDAELEEEVGDLLFAAVAVARHVSVHPMPALENAVRKFERRLRNVVRQAEEGGIDLADASLEELEAAWRAAKRDLGEGEDGRNP